MASITSDFTNRNGNIVIEAAGNNAIARMELLCLKLSFSRLYRFGITKLSPSAHIFQSGAAFFL